ncbi:MAG: hypothetical protein M1839_001655 [Geoglossum umbratile]|nr:MAG: hypothetical protein M1839_001655 [Geoglossum umbratile]
MTRGKTEEEFDKLMLDLTRNPGDPRRAKVGYSSAAGLWKPEKKGAKDAEFSKLLPETIPALEVQTIDIGNIYLVDSENKNFKHRMRMLPVPGDGNCFWAAFASAFHGDSSQWARVKLQTLSYFRAVKNNAGHPRHRLYQMLDSIAGQDGPGVESQLAGLNFWTSSETTQIVADLFNVELVIVFRVEGSPETEVIFRGLHNRQQVFLYLSHDHWVGLKPAGVYASDFRWEHHAGRINCRVQVMEDDGTFKVPRALIPRPRIPEILAKDVEKLVRGANVR